MIREDGEELHMMLKEATCMAQGRRMWRLESNHRRAADAGNCIAWTITVKRK